MGRHSVKAVRVARRGARNVIARADLLRIPAELTDRSGLVGKWLAGFSGHARMPCVIGLPARTAVFQPVSVPPSDPRAPHQIVGVEMARFNELASENMVYDFLTVPGAGQGRRLLLCMARPAAIDEAFQLPDSLRLNVVEVIPAPLALYCAAEAAGLLNEQPAILADIGHAATELAVADATGPKFAGSLNCGGQAFTEAFAHTTGVSLAHAEHMKAGGEPNGKPEISLNTAMRKAEEQWANELRTFLAVYRTSFPDPADQPARLILSGGGAGLAGLADRIGQASGLPSCLLTDLPTRRALENPARFALAYGLALAAQRSDEQRLSLLPRRVREMLELRSQKRWWGAAAVAAGLILAVSLVGGYRDSERMRKHLKTQELALTRCQDLAQQIEAVKANSKLIEDMLAPVQRLVRNGPLFRDVLTTVARAKHPDDLITRICDAASYLGDKAAQPQPYRSIHRRYRPRGANPGPDPAAADKHGASFDRVVIEGYTAAKDFSRVKEMISRLVESELVASADLLRDDQLAAETGQAPALARAGKRRFVIDVRVAQ